MHTSFISRNMAPSPADGVAAKPLDGGWGWVVVFGAHISIGFAYSMPKVLPIFFKEIQEDLGTTSSEISLISSIMLAAIYGAGNGPRTGNLQTSAAAPLSHSFFFFFLKLFR